MILCDLNTIILFWYGSTYINVGCSSKNLQKLHKTNESIVNTHTQKYEIKVT